MLNRYLAGQVILINKPYKWTSFDAVRKVKGLIQKAVRGGFGFPVPGSHFPVSVEENSVKPETGNAKQKIKLKIGHAGTLDPLATGLLIICTGKFTKKIEEIVGSEKEYTGSFTLGATTESFDLERPVDGTFPTEHITPEMIQKATLQFLGEQQQVPPAHSAVKVDGRRAYKLARKGRDFTIHAKYVTISEFEITGIEMPFVHFRVVCSKGTYIRSLARDFGLALGSGAYVSALCRTRIGEYRLGQALSPEDFEKELVISVNAE